MSNFDSGPAAGSEYCSLISVKTVCARTAISRASLYRFIDEGTFPKPVRLSPGRIAFVESEVEGWVKRKIAESRAPCLRRCPVPRVFPETMWTTSWHRRRSPRFSPAWAGNGRRLSAA